MFLRIKNINQFHQPGKSTEKSEQNILKACKGIKSLIIDLNRKLRPNTGTTY